MKFDLTPYKHLFRDYMELRAQENRRNVIALLNGDVLTNCVEINAGVSARIYARGKWGFASQSEMSAESVERVARQAGENADFLADSAAQNASALPRTAGIDAHDFAAQQPELSRKDLIDFLRVLDGYLAKQSPRLLSRVLTLNTQTSEKQVVTSDGAVVSAVMPRALLEIRFVVGKKGSVAEIATVYGGFGHFCDYFMSFEPLYEECDRQFAHLLRKVEGVYPQAGVAECVLDADVVGLLAHEASLAAGGHALNSAIASPLVTLTDFAQSAFGKPCPAPVFVDDEGTPARDVVLIERGVLAGALRDKVSAAREQAQPTGNALAAQFSDAPAICARNAVISPGAQTLAEMIASIDDGYYLMSAERAQAVLPGEFACGVTMGYEIKHGKLVKAIRGATISGRPLDALNTVSMVAKEMAWRRGGLGVNSLNPVGMGGAALTCRVAIGGR